MYMTRFVLFLFLVFGGGAVLPPVFASDDQAAAQYNRAAAVARTQRQLGYESLPQEEFPPQQVDFDALSRQIKNLASIIERMTAEKNANADSLLFRGVPSGPAYRERLFGQSGPDVASVSALVQYRLVISGNQNLRLGHVLDDGQSVEAAVVTRDGSLVEKVRINKASGQINTIR